MEALSLPSAVRNLLVYPFTCAYMRARNIIMCIRFSSCSVAFKKYLWCPVVNQRVTNKFQKSVRKIRWYVWQLGWNRVPLHPQSREMRHWNSVWLTWWDKRRRVLLYKGFCTRYLTLAGLREREGIRPFGACNQPPEKKFKKTFENIWWLKINLLPLHPLFQTKAHKEEFFETIIDKQTSSTSLHVI